MSDERFAQLVIFLAMLMLPYLLFVTGNTYTSWWLTGSRAAIAVAAGWCLAFAYAIAARAINISIASPAELLALYDRDGAPLAFAAVLGWVPALFVVAVAWLVHSVALPHLRGERSNYSSKRTRETPRAA